LEEWDSESRSSILNPGGTEILVEQPCYKCGQAVEQGVAFCPHCGAPQIRVVIAEPSPPSPVSADGAVAEVPRSGIPSPSGADASFGLSNTWRPCALAAVLGILLSFLGLYVPVTMIVAGFLAVVLFRRRRGGSGMRPLIGAQLGALSGLIGSALIALVIALVYAAPSTRDKLRDQLLENAEKWVAARPGQPQVQAAFDQLKTPEGFAVALVGGVLLLMLVCVGLGCLGGAIGGAVFSRRDQP
jgi:hypothetical protein